MGPRTESYSPAAEVSSPTVHGRTTTLMDPMASGPGWMPASDLKNHPLTEPNMEWLCEYVVAIGPMLPKGRGPATSM